MGNATDQPPATPIHGQRIVVTGAAGQLGGYLVGAIRDAGGTPITFGHHEGAGINTVIDITDAVAVERAIDDAKPDVIIHAAAMTDVDGCEKNPELAERINHVGTRNIALAANRSGAYMIGVSTDFVFSGDQPPYSEDAPTDPVSVYGSSKRAGEVAVQEVSDHFAIARTAWLYGGEGKHFPRSILSLLATRPSIDVVEDERGNPTFADDLAQALVQLAAIRPAGILHLVNEGATSRFDLARSVASLAGIPTERVQPTTVEAFLRQYPLPARRPADSSLKNQRAADKGVTLRHWKDALASYVPRLAQELRSRQG